jgi:HlyD family secretion protein
MRLGFIWAAGSTILCAIVVLFSPMDEYVNAPGEVRPSEFSLVFNKTDGILESVSVADGQYVQKGEVLARVDSWEIKKTIGRIESDIEQAKAELELSRANARKVEAAPVPPEFLFSALEVERQQEIQGIQQNYLKRLNDLQKTGAASGTEVLNVRLQLIAAETMLKRSQQANELFTGAYGQASREEALGKEKVAEASLKSLERNLTLARADLERLDIIAPESGTILATARRFPGEKVLSGEALFKITNNTGTELRLYATEDRVDRIKPGQLVRFRANNNPDRLAPLATGRVAEVALDRDLNPDQEEKAASSSYRITVTVEKAPYPLAVGATVQAEVVIDRRPFWGLLFLKTTAK